MRQDERVTIKVFPESYAELLKIKAGILEREGRNLVMDSRCQDKSLIWILIKEYKRRKEWVSIQ